MKASRGKSHTRTTITLAGDYGADKQVSAIILSPRVAVHLSYREDGFSVSDPKTGCAYWHGRHATEDQAIKRARALMRKFGRDPLRGSILADRQRWIRKPRKFDELRRFAMDCDL